MTDSSSDRQPSTFLIGALRDAAFNALTLINTAGEALLIMAVMRAGSPATANIPGDEDDSAADPPFFANVAPTPDSFVVLGANDAARVLFANLDDGISLDAISTELDEAVRAVQHGTLEQVEQRLKLEGIAYRIRVRFLIVDGRLLVGLSLNEIAVSGPKDIPDDETGILAYPIEDERSLARRIAVRALYEIDTAHHPLADALQLQMRLIPTLPKAARYAEYLVHGVTAHHPQLDAAVQRYATEFPVDQLAVIDRNILRIALLEFAVDQRTPVSVAINEAVELAKIYGADGSPAFVNGVLGSIAEDTALCDQLHSEVGRADADTDPLGG